MGLFALANSFTMRVCLSMTITQMVTKTAPSEHIIGEVCPDYDQETNVTKDITPFNSSSVFVVS